MRGQKPQDPGYPECPQTVGEHLRKRRIDLGLRQKDTAELLGTSSASVLHWEKAVHEPAIRFWPAIIHFLGYDPHPEPVSIPERLKAVRRRHGWSQRRLAEHIGVDPTAILHWESGKKPHHRRTKTLLQDLFVREGVE